MAMDINRNQFLLIGLVLLFFGLQLRFVDTFVLNEQSTRYLAKQSAKVEEAQGGWSLPLSMVAETTAIPIQRKRIQPPTWLAWSFLSVGIVLSLHALSLKKPD